MHDALPLTDQPDLADALEKTIVETGWTHSRERDGVAVAWGNPAGHRARAYLTTLTVPAPLNAVASLLGERLFDAFAGLNRHWHAGDVLQRDPLVVRTAFRLPAPLAPREFVHALGRHSPRHGTVLVAYGPVDDRALAPPHDGFLRCPIEVSGQRLTDLGDGTTRVEHCMGYLLGGGVVPWVQSHLFHRGHVAAYLDEWRGLPALLQGPGHAP